MPNLFLNTNDTVSPLGFTADVSGSTGTETVGIAAGTTGVVVDQNIERVDLPGNAADFTFQQAGNALQVYSAGNLMITIPLQGDADGTQIVFGDGSASATLATGVMSLGDAVVSSTAVAIVPTLDAATTSLTAVAGTGGSPAVTADTVSLTSGVDKLTANVFNAERVFDPSGDDQMNSLQDDDVLTGSGTNPTLNFSFVTDTQTQDYDVSPTFKGIETVNIAASHSFATKLDLQDATGLSNAINITRMDSTVEVDNLTSTQTNLSVANSSEVDNDLNFLYTDSALSGATDTTTLTMSNAQIGTLAVEETLVDGALNQGYETINLVSSTSNNTIKTLSTEDLVTLNISGDKKLTVQGEDNVAGSLTTVNASTFTADLMFTITDGVMSAIPDGKSNGDIAFTLTSNIGNDKITISETIGTTDTIATGDGTDTLVVNAVHGTDNYTANDDARPQVTGVEKVDLLNGHVTAAVVGGNETIGFLADQATGDQSFTLRNDEDFVGFNTTYNIMNLTATEATSITIEHSGQKTNNPAASSNAITDNIINLDVADGVASATVTLAEGVNIDPRFNVEIYTDSDISINDKTGARIDDNVDNGTNTVTSITIADTDSESNTVELSAQSETSTGIDRGQITAYTDTITVTGGQAKTFMNLDATANIYGYDQTGAQVDTFGSSTGAIDITNGAAERILAATFDASTAGSNVIARFSSNPNDTNGGQSITMGSGDDTVIFDHQASTNAGTAVGNAGLTISDTVTGGEGSDTLVIDGDSTNTTLGASEWTNVKGFETIKTVGLGANNNIYSLTLTDQLIDDNAADGDVINISNDNDQANDTADAPFNAAASDESAIRIDARSLSASNSFNYDGEEGASRTDDTFIFSDANINGKVVIDGGAVDNTTSGHVTGTHGNNDVLEVRNAAQLDLGDLANIKNVGEIQFTHDGTNTQNSRLQLNDTIVDAMVDSYQSSVSATSVTPNVEVLRVTAFDNTSVANIGAATTGLTLEANTLTNKSAVDVMLGRGINDVTTGSGDDTVIILGNYTTADYTNAAGQAITFADTDANGTHIISNGSAVGANVNVLAYQTGIANLPANDLALQGSIEMGAGDNKIITYGAVDMAVLATNVTSTNGTQVLLSHSNVKMTESQYDSFKSITFDGPGAHTLVIVDDSNNVVKDLDKSKVSVINTIDNTVPTVTVSTEGDTTFNAGSAATGISFGVKVAAPVFSLAVSPASVTEGDAGTTATATATVTRTDTTDAVTIDIATADGSATAGSDYTEVTTTQLSFAAGAATAIQDISITGDADVETDENFTVAISNPSAGTLDAAASSATVTITNDDTAVVVTPAPVFSLAVSPTSVTEGDAGTTATATATVTRTDTTDAVTIDIATADGSATAGSDYTEVTTTQLSFAAGAATATQDISITGDADVETDETFTVTISNPSIGTLDTAATSATATITNDDIVSSAKAVAINSTGIDDSGADNTEDAEIDDITFTFEKGDYTYTIANFGSGDVLDLPLDTASVSIVNAAADGELDIAVAEDGLISTIKLTGIDPAIDAQIFSADTFNAQFAGGLI